ncbi:MAG: 16S rRNA (uracil(1498)-N(3))-methyltransferase [Candidatus Promineifilaceae bacterium]
MTHRFFIPSQNGYQVDETIDLPQEVAHQLRHVLRVQPGEQVVVLDDRGWEYVVQLTQLEKRAGQGVVTAVSRNENEPSLQLTLFMSLLKRDNFEWVLQKGTELGVSCFVPVVTSRTVVTAVSPNKFARWQRIVQEAAEQCRRGRIPTIAPVTRWDDALALAAQNDGRFIPWELAEGATIAKNMPPNAASAALFIGPEGGFTEDEVAQAQAAGVGPVTLGARILRAETAALTAVTLVMAAVGELNKG